MRTRIIAAASGTALGIVFATCETLGAATAITVPQGVRSWMLGALIAVVIGTSAAAILDRLADISRRLDGLEVGTVEQRARRDHDAIERQIRDNVTYLHPEE